MFCARELLIVVLVVRSLLRVAAWLACVVLCCLLLVGFGMVLACSWLLRCGAWFDACCLFMCCGLRLACCLLFVVCCLSVVVRWSLFLVCGSLLCLLVAVR